MKTKLGWRICKCMSSSSLDFACQDSKPEPPNLVDGSENWSEQSCSWLPLFQFEAVRDISLGPFDARQESHEARLLYRPGRRGWPGQDDQRGRRGWAGGREAGIKTRGGWWVSNLLLFSPPFLFLSISLYFLILLVSLFFQHLIPFILSDLKRLISNQLLSFHNFNKACTLQWIVS